MSDESDPPRERKRLAHSNLESAIDKQIREAMERGDFDNLRGRGKPLNLARDPNVPAEWELAFDLLKNAGFAPDWIELANQIRASREKLLAPFRRYIADLPRSDTEKKRLQSRLIEQFRTHASELNKQIDIYNLKAPSTLVHVRRIRIEHEIEEFLRQASDIPRKNL